LTNILKVNESLKPGQFLITKDQLYKLILQTDGNLVLYRDTTPLWDSKTCGHAVYDAILKSDGNFVLEESPGKVYWNTATPGNLPILVLQNDGNARIYDQQKGDAIWETNTAETIAKVGVEWIENFSDQACTIENQVDYVGEMSRDFYNVMGDHGNIKVFCWGEGDAWATDFIFPDPKGVGDSLNWTDNVHICWYRDHGGNQGTNLKIAFTNQTHGCDCYSNQWKLGIKQLKWLILCCCHGLPDVIDVGQIAARYFPPAQGIHIILGCMWNWKSSSWNRSLGHNFADDITSGSPICGAWLDEASSSWLGDSVFALSFGATDDEVIDRGQNETLSWRNYDAGNNYMYIMIRQR
jgi:hypothetical protein